MGVDEVAVGVDVGGTKIHAAVVDREFGVINEVRVPTPTGGVEEVGAGIVETVAMLGFNGQQLRGVGIGLPGIVDSLAGSVRHAVNLGIDDEATEIVSWLSASFNVPCWVANDVNAAALGAYVTLRRDHSDLRDLAYLSIGTGIAAGVILDGRIYRGQNGFSGEIGHLLVDPNGPKCACGLRGCLEAVASGAALARQWPLPGQHPSSALSLFDAAGRGDDKATPILRRAVEHLARAIHVLSVTFDVDCIVIGGGVADDSGSLLLDPLIQALQRLGDQSSYARALGLPDRVMLKPPEPVGVIGAAALTRWSLSA